jgi:hypothetical protein
VLLIERGKRGTDVAASWGNEWGGSKHLALLGIDTQISLRMYHYEQMRSLGSSNQRIRALVLKPTVTQCF